MRGIVKKVAVVFGETAQDFFGFAPKMVAVILLGYLLKWYAIVLFCSMLAINFLAKHGKAKIETARSEIAKQCAEYSTPMDCLSCKSRKACLEARSGKKVTEYE